MTDNTECDKIIPSIKKRVIIVWAYSIWLIIATVTLIVDLLTSSFFFIGFTFGGICAIIAQSFGAGLAGQTIAFIFWSGMFISICTPYARRLLNKTVPKTLTMEEEMVGRKIVLECDVSETSTASIKIDGIYWTVKASEPLSKGDIAIITAIDGTKFIIKKFVGNKED